MDYMIITNNPLVKNEYDNVKYVNGSFLDVLITIRDMIHNGYVLVSHPLGASVRMLFSPYRSIVVGEKAGDINPFSLEIIENSIINYQKHMEKRDVDYKNAHDYSMVDKELLNSTLKSVEEFKNIWR